MPAGQRNVAPLPMVSNPALEVTTPPTVPEPSQ